MPRSPRSRIISPRLERGCREIMRVITRNDETSAGRYLLAKSFVTCARRSCAGCCPLPRRTRPKKSGRPSSLSFPPPPPLLLLRRSTGRFSRVTHVRDLLVPRPVPAACSRCAPLISFTIDGYLSSHMSLKRRAQTSGYVFPVLGVRVPPFHGFAVTFGDRAEWLPHSSLRDRKD